MKEIIKADKERVLYNGKIKLEFFDKGHKYLVNGERIGKSSTGITGLKNKPFLLPWACNMMEEYLFDFLEKTKSFSVTTLRQAITISKSAHRIKKEDAANSGSMVHDWIESYINHELKLGDKPETPKDKNVLNGILAFMKWRDENDIKFVSTEKLIYSKKYGYCGISDVEFTMGSEKHKILHLGDWKTGAPNKISFQKNKEWVIAGYCPYSEHRYQVRGYEGAEIEATGVTYGDAMIAYLDKDTGEFRQFWLPADEFKKDFKAFIGLNNTFNREKELKESEKLIINEFKETL